MADGQSCRLPFREAFAHAAGTPAALQKQFDGTIGIDAVRSAAVCNVLFVPRQGPEAILQLVNGNGNRTSDVSRAVLVGWTRVEDDDVPGAGAMKKVAHLDRFRLRSVAKMLCNQPLQIRESSLGDHTNGSTQLEHPRISETVVDVETVFARIDQRGPPQGLQVLRRVGERESDFRGQRLDGSLALSQELEHLDPVRAANRLSDPGELRVQAILELAMCLRHDQVINKVLDYWLSSSTS